MVKWKTYSKTIRTETLPALTNKYDKEYIKKKRFELNKSTKQSHRRFVSVDLALKVNGLYNR